MALMAPMNDLPLSFVSNLVVPAHSRLTYMVNFGQWNVSRLNVNDALQNACATCLLEFPKSRTLTIPNTGADVEQQELSCIAGGNAKQ